MTTRTTIELLLTLALGASLLGACGDVAEPQPEASVAGDACEHLQQGPSAALVAGIDRAHAADASALHTRYDLSLVALEGGNGGYLQLAIAEAGHYAFALDRPLTLTLSDANGVDLAVHEALATDACDELEQLEVYDLGIGTVFVAIAPTLESSARLVVAEGHEHAHD